MLTRIKEMKVTKGLLGVMLASIILSVPVFAISIRSFEVTEQPVNTVKTTAKSTMQKPVTQPETPVAAVVPKPSPTVTQKNTVQPTAPAHSLSPADLQLLARVIYAESRGEPFEGQVAVGAVLLNRLNDSRFPRTLSQIIFKQGEFCTVRDGQIWNTPNQEAIKAAKLAVAGWDPTGGAVYFYNPAKTTSRWIWSRVVTNKIGNHIFAA